jgi:hypothetical protein
VLGILSPFTKITNNQVTSYLPAGKQACLPAGRQTNYNIQYPITKLISLIIEIWSWFDFAHHPSNHPELSRRIGYFLIIVTCTLVIFHANTRLLVTFNF